MPTEDSRSLGQREQSRLDDALAALLASTRRVKRSLNLIEVNAKLRTAVRLLGSHRAVADALGLSDETLRQFSRIEKLSPRVRKLVATRRITSMDLADRLSRFPAADQYPLASAVVSGALDARDVRAILPLRKTMPKVPLRQLIQRVEASRNIREYVAEFLTPQPTPKPDTLLRRVSPVVARREIHGIEVRDPVGHLILTGKGKRALEAAAKERGVTKREFLQRLISSGVS